MVKKALLVATSVIALAAVGAQTASAQWYDKGVALNAGQNPTIALTGTFGYSSPNATLYCNNAIATLQMTGGSTDGHITALNSENPANCEAGGGIPFLCSGTTIVKSLELTGQPTAVNNGGADIQVTGFVLHQECTNGFRLKMDSIAGSPLTITPDNLKAMTKVAISGTLTSGVGNLSMFGELSVLAPNVGTYGLIE